MALQQINKYYSHVSTIPVFVPFMPEITVAEASRFIKIVNIFI